MYLNWTSGLSLHQSQMTVRQQTEEANGNRVSGRCGPKSLQPQVDQSQVNLAHVDPAP